MGRISSVATQLVRQLDYFFINFGNRLFGFSDTCLLEISVFSYAVLLFHVWMPYVVLYSLSIVRYHRSAVVWQVIVGCTVILLSFLLTKDMHLIRRKPE
jgi:hypothetical protein